MLELISQRVFQVEFFRCVRNLLMTDSLYEFQNSQKNLPDSRNLQGTSFAHRNGRSTFYSFFLFLFLSQGDPIKIEVLSTSFETSFRVPSSPPFSLRSSLQCLLHETLFIVNLFRKYLNENNRNVKEEWRKKGKRRKRSESNTESNVALSWI